MTPKQSNPEGHWLNDVKVGDRIWTGERRYDDGSGLTLHTVTSRTAKEIRTGEKDKTGRYYWTFRVTQSKFDGSFIAFHVRGGMFRDSIHGIASPKECREWDEKEAKKKQAATDRSKAEELRANKRAELRELFAPDSETNTVYVTDAEWTEDKRAGKFDLTFHGITEQQVRDIAAKIAEKSR